MRIFWQRLQQHSLIGAAWVSVFGMTSGFFFPGSLQAAHMELSVDQAAGQGVRFTPMNVPPPDRGTPRAPYGTGSRGDCPSNANLPPLTHLVGERGLELTVSERPSFWVYVPYDRSQVAAGRFFLQEGDKEVYQADVQLPATTPGIISITMPQTMPSLEVGKRYRWYFEVLCPQTDPSETPSPATVTGIVERVLPPEALLNELANAQSPLERVSAYANHHIWYDTLTEFGQLRLSEPDQVEQTRQWKNLLRDPQVGLANWSEAPIVGEAIATQIKESWILE